MIREDLIRGWCPSLFRPMESGDGWLARVRPQAGAVAADLAVAVADAADRFGNGVIEITNRGNIQIRGLTADSIAPFTTAIEAAGGAAGEGSRVLVSPLLGADSTLPSGLLEIAVEVDRALAATDLPAKFGIVLDGGGALPLTGISLDITVRFVSGRWLVNDVPCAPGAIASEVSRLARQGTARITTRSGQLPLPGYHAMGDGGFGLVTPAFGQMTAGAFAGLARIAARDGDGRLRPTPWKSLCIAGVGAGHAARVLQQAAALGLITAPDDGRLSVVTCAGAPACARGEVETHMAARFLARTRRAEDQPLHLSGCTKGCAHPGPAAVTLVGRAGTFDLIRDGRPSDRPAIRDLTLAEIPALMQSLLP